MKEIKLFLLMFCWTLIANAQTNDSAIRGQFIDKRDGQTYDWVKMMDGKKWMASNLNFQIDSSFCYLEQDSMCQKYGRLYTLEAALKACPEGWHLPSDQEWWDLLLHYGMAMNSMGKRPRNMQDTSGVDAFKNLTQGEDAFIEPLGGGMRRNKLVRNFGIDFIKSRDTYFWSSTKVDIPKQRAWYYSFSWEYERAARFMGWRVFAYSCRCVAD